MDLGGGIFENVTASTITFRLEKKRGNAESVTKVVTDIRDLENHIYKTTLINQTQFLLNESYVINIFSDEAASGLLSKVKENVFNLSEEFDICAGGIATGPDKAESISTRKQSDIYKPLIEGKDVKPYLLNYRGLFIEYDRKKLYRAREEDIFKKPEKLITQRIGGGSNPLVVAYDDKQFYTFNSTNSIYPKPKAKTPIKYILAVLNSKVLNWLYSSQYSNNSCLTVNISKTYLDNLPISKASKENIIIIVSVVDYILFLKGVNSKSSNFFERLIDAMVYELYLPDEIKAAGCEVLKHLTDLPELKGGWSDERKLTVIEKVYKELADPKHPVSIAMAKMQDVPEVKIIEGREKAGSA